MGDCCRVMDPGLIDDISLYSGSSSSSFTYTSYYEEYKRISKKYLTEIMNKTVPSYSLCGMEIRPTGEIKIIFDQK